MTPEQFAEYNRYLQTAEALRQEASLLEDRIKAMPDGLAKANAWKEHHAYVVAEVRKVDNMYVAYDAKYPGTAPKYGVKIKPVTITDEQVIAGLMSPQRPPKAMAPAIIRRPYRGRRPV